MREKMYDKYTGMGEYWQLNFLEICLYIKICYGGVGGGRRFNVGFQLYSSHQRLQVGSVVRVAGVGLVS